MDKLTTAVFYCVLRNHHRHPAVIRRRRNIIQSAITFPRLQIDRHILTADHRTDGIQYRHCSNTGVRITARIRHHQRHRIRPKVAARETARNSAQAPSNTAIVNKTWIQRRTTAIIYIDRRILTYRSRSR